MGFRYQKIKSACISWPYSLLFVVVIVGFVWLNIRLNKSYFFFENVASFSSSFAFFFVLLGLLVALLVALTVNLSVLRFVESRKISVRSSSSSLGGMFAGILGGGCPACVVGVFPAVMGLFGLSVSLADLPLSGLELQIVSILLLFFSVYLLSGPVVCSSKKGKFKTAR